MPLLDSGLEQATQILLNHAEIPNHVQHLQLNLDFLIISFQFVYMINMKMEVEF